MTPLSSSLKIHFKSIHPIREKRKRFFRKVSFLFLPLFFHLPEFSFPVLPVCDRRHVVGFFKFAIFLWLEGLGLNSNISSIFCNVNERILIDNDVNVCDNMAGGGIACSK